MENIKITIRIKDLESAIKFLEIANSYISDINIYDGSNVLDAKSTFSIMSIFGNKDLKVMIISDDIAECRRFDSEMEKFI